MEQISCGYTGLTAQLIAKSGKFLPFNLPLDKKNQYYCAVQQFWCPMLREWIRNIPLALLRQIVADRRVRGNYIWQLATEELERRKVIAA